MASDLRPSVASPPVELDPAPSALLAHQEAPALAPLPGLEASASEVHSPASALGMEHQALVSDQVVHQEHPASVQEAHLEPTALDSEPPEAAALL